MLGRLLGDHWTLLADTLLSEAGDGRSCAGKSRPKREAGENYIDALSVSFSQLLSFPLLLLWPLQSTSVQPQLLLSSQNLPHTEDKSNAPCQESNLGSQQFQGGDTAWFLIGKIHEGARVQFEGDMISLLRKASWRNSACNIIKYLPCPHRTLGDFLSLSIHSGVEERIGFPRLQGRAKLSNRKVGSLRSVGLLFSQLNTQKCLPA